MSTLRSEEHVHGLSQIFTRVDHDSSDHQLAYGTIHVWLKESHISGVETLKQNGLNLTRGQHEG